MKGDVHMPRKEKNIFGKDIAVRTAEVSLGKGNISPMERWKMVAEAAYYRAQKRGFIGGNPIDDWMEAEREIDARYNVDYSKIMASFDPSEMMNQFAKAFGGIFYQANIDDLLESQRKNIEALTRANKLVFDNARSIVDRQMEMFRYAMEQAVSSVKHVSESESESAKDVAVQQVRVIELCVEKSLASMLDITESIIEANARAFDIASRRMAESMSEIKRSALNTKG
jgi:hypothetical protein